MSGKKNQNGALKQNEKIDERSKSQLFSEVDAKSVELSGYTLGHGAPQGDEFMEEHSLPTGVVDIDESIVLPTLSADSYPQHDSKPYTIIRPSKPYDREHVQLPPIIRQPHPHDSHGYHDTQPNHYQSRCFYHSQLIRHEHQSYHHHHHHHHHRHHRHRKTYDSRWWYMPLNSVHGPKSQRSIDYDYVPSKWYEIPRR